MSARNSGNSALARRREAGDPMARYDRLPPELRAWLAEALLPWSPRSALRAWHRALQRHGGDAERARAALSRCERRQIARDARRVWGRAHPAAEEPQGAHV